jgi:hypothetical protein
MADDKLTPSETAMLLLLMAENREISNPELKEKYGVTLTGPNRKRLENRKLVESRKGLRGAYFYTLSEAGWARCNDGFDVGDVRPRAAGQALTAVLTGLQRYLRATGLKMVHVFALETAPGPAVVPADQDRPSDLEALIRRAYKELARTPGDYVSLLALRSALRADQRDVDLALVRMVENSDDVVVIPESKQSELTDDLRRAAVRIGDQDKHLIKIASS